MHVSASQKSKYIGCPRKWAYYKQRPRTPAGKGAEESSQAHAVAENWLRDGTVPDPSTGPGLWVQAGMHLLPLPGQAVVEQEFDETIGNIRHIGRIDFLTTTQNLPPEIRQRFPEGDHVCVGDHKFLRDLGYRSEVGHVKADQNFEWDPQRILYGTVLCQTLNVTAVAFFWNNIEKSKEPYAAPTTYFETREDLLARFGELYHRVTLPIYHGQGQPPEAFERNLTHCSAYGGCPYKDECLRDVPPHERIAATMRSR